MKFQRPHFKQKQHRHGRKQSFGNDRAVDGSQGFPLTEVQSGQQVRLMGVRDRRVQRLLNRGLSPGDVLTILNVQNSGSVLVSMGEMRLSIGAGLAQDLMVMELNPSLMEEKESETKMSLNDLSVGAMGKVVSYTQAAREYKGKLLSMGLTPGARFTVTRVAPLGDPIAITVRGFHLSLRRQEAAGLLVEEVES
ncbi:FeoA family protein [Halothece sp. PCC 7418]|uniref:ferrous iron transport protein A n=1 Tax=Halothece sp. (strain PCC 7418) TaxID=65093 RepID=UPI0002A08C5A|nr:FeoA family protein [Halothece sp. PCC 7418]AFZ43857.1 FeoA family protein [Halothece sp. PCC 7418]